MSLEIEMEDKIYRGKNGKYKQISLIFEGGQGSVYLCENVENKTK